MEEKTNLQEAKKPDIRSEQVAFQITDEKRFNLLKSIAQTITNKTIKKPKKNCKHCFGRGYTGYLNGIKSIPVPCRCVYVRKAF